MNANNLQGNFKTLFESDYPGSDILYKNLISPLWAGTEKSKKVIFLDEEDKSKINSVVIFAFQGSDINFVDVELADSVVLKRNRVTINKYISKTILDIYQSALIFFHYKDSSREWRISYVYKGADNTDRTNPKRFTYLCGKNQHCRTAAQRFSELEKCNGYPTGQDMVDTFSVEPLTKDFFEKYKQQYADLVEYISGKRFVKVKGRFIEERTKNANSVFKTTFDGDDKAVRDYVKKMMGRLVFLQFLQKKGWLGVKKGAEWGTGDKSFIYNLFDRAPQKIQEDFFEQVLEPLFFNTLNYDRGQDAMASAEICSIYGEEIRIPYLNGGLFEKDTLDEKKVKFKKEHFQSLFDFFRQYNFTIDETDPDDTEIGVDPEMLGKIFENLLEDNKDKGAFYTPKEIVQYMCRESLIAYLMTDSDFNEEKIRTFVLNHTGDFSDTEKKTLLTKLRDVKVCDPAVGSGAFPMGMLNELYACRHYLEEDCLPVEIKKQIIKENLYGVDIEKGAVDIARLRFWLSIVVDEETPLPLPNLDYKIMQGNSLLESYEGIDLSILTQGHQTNLFDTENTVEKLIEAINGFYMPHDQEAKAKIRLQIKEFILHRLKVFNDSETVAKLSQIDLHANTSFFLWHTWFYDVFNRPNNKNGFDIVIGNPPYIKEHENKKAFVDLKKQSPYYMGKMDLWHGFACISFDLLKFNGILSFIAQNQWYTSKGASNLRESIRNNGTILKINDFNTYMVFNDASTQTMIFFIQKNSSQSKYSFIFRKILSDNPTEKDMIDCIGDKEIASILSYNNLIYDRMKMINKDLHFNNTIDEIIISKIKDKANFIFAEKEICQGIIGGPDEAFKLSDEEVKKLTNHEKKNIHKFYTCTEKYVTPTSFINIFYSTKDNVKYFTEDEYPYLYEKLSKYSERLRNRRETKNGKNKWFHCWWPREENVFLIGKKLIWTSRSTGGSFAYEEGEFYGSRNLFFVKTNRVNLKYITALLNSTIYNYVMQKVLKHNGKLLQIDKNQFKKIPLYNSSEAEQQPIISLVDKILAAKKENPSADTSAEERQIDLLVYRLYNLTFEEAKIIDNTLTEEEFNGKTNE